jgi:tripartite-type tricarboxylate transporter receptor subunit TctC
MRFLALVFVAISAGLAPAAFADSSYPTRPITMIVPFSAGGPADFIGRLLAQQMAKTLGQPIVIENVDGAGGLIAAGRVARAPADGYTIMVDNQGFAASPGLYATLPYDIEKDFRAIGLISRSPMVLIGRRDLPADDLSGLVAYVKKNGPQVTFAHAGVGGVAHLCSLMFDSTIGVNPTLVPYRGGSQVMNDIIAGHVDMYCGLWDTYEAIKNKLTKGYVVLGNERLEAVANIPTAKELGYADMELYAWYALFAPNTTPEPIIGKLNEALRQALDDADIKKRFISTGSILFPQEQLTTTAATTYFDAEMKRLTKLLRANNVTPQ